jgi:hypothetical protein
MCFVWIWEQTAIISLYNINWLVYITERECVYCAVRTGSLYIIQVMCFVWNWEQTAIISLYSINWLVCITETECVYCAVRTESLNVILVNLTVWTGDACEPSKKQCSFVSRTVGPDSTVQCSTCTYCVTRNTVCLCMYFPLLSALINPVALYSSVLTCDVVWSRRSQQVTWRPTYTCHRLISVLFLFISIRFSSSRAIVRSSHLETTL